MQGLNALKDIHLPALEPWWVMAWGWWLLLGLLLLCMVAIWKSLPAIGAWRAKAQAKKAVQHDVQEALRSMRAAYAEKNDGLVLLRSISVLLRRVSITVFGRDRSACLINDAWLDFLDQQWGDSKPERLFSDAINANLLKKTAYQGKISKNIQSDIEKLLYLTEKWVMKVVKSHV